MVAKVDRARRFPPFEILSQLDAGSLKGGRWAVWELEFEPYFAFAGVDFAEPPDPVWILS